MSPLSRALWAEALKLRGTLALWMCAIAPAVVVALLVLQIAFSDFTQRSPMEPGQAWPRFAQSVLVLWSFLMLPLFVTLQSALLAGLEHANQQWKHLLALPLPRSAHYLAKQVALTAMLALAMVLLAVFIVLGGIVLGAVKPVFGITGSPPWKTLVEGVSACFAASLLIVSLHNWISIRWRSFTVVVSIGMGATVAGYLIGQSARFGHLYPWSMPSQVFAGKGEWIGFVVVAGLLGGAAVTLVGLWDFTRREVA